MTRRLVCVNLFAEEWGGESVHRPARLLLGLTTGAVFGTEGGSPLSRQFSAQIAASGQRQRFDLCVDADVIILAGSVGLDDAWTCGRPRFALPLPGRTFLDDLLSKVTSSCSGSITVCSNGHWDVIESVVRRFDSVEHPVRLVEDSMPMGTAGCVKACEPHLTGRPILVIGGAVWLEDDLAWMLERHRADGNALTIYCIPHQVRADGCTQSRLRPAGVFCLDPSALAQVRGSGFQDIKEQLVPALIAGGQRVGAVSLSEQTHQVADWPTYLHALTRSITRERLDAEGYKALAPGIWCGEDVQIAPDARIVGPAIIGHHARLAPGSVVIGPVLLGEHCTLEAGAWAVRAVIPAATRVHESTHVTDVIVPAAPPAPSTCASCARLNPPTVPVLTASYAGSRTPGVWAASGASRRDASPAWAGLMVGAAFLWAFWPNLESLWNVWQFDGNYSAGQLVPLASAYMLYLQRHRLKAARPTLGIVGPVLFLAGLAMNVAGAHYLYASAANFGMLICTNAAALMLLGWPVYRQVWYPLVFLALMLPLPGRVHDAVMIPLQTLGAQVSATILEVGGIPVERFGNVLEVSGHRVAVAEACNGLRMALAFLIVTGVVAYVIPRPHWQRAVVLLSSVPIALGCNVFRIVVTACLYRAGQAWLAEGIFHDGAGLLMMPLAVGLILVELWVLQNLADSLGERLDVSRVAPGTSVASAR